MRFKTSLGICKWQAFKNQTFGTLHPESRLLLGECETYSESALYRASQKPTQKPPFSRVFMNPFIQTIRVPPAYFENSSVKGKSVPA